MEVLTKSEYEDIEFLLRIGQIIREDYDKLYELEKDKNKYSEEYREALSHLCSSIKLEENTFSRLSDSFEKGISIVQFLVEQSKCDFFKASLDFHLDKEKQVLFRYINKFTLASLQDKKGMKKKMFSKEEISEVYGLGIEDAILQSSTLPVYFSLTVLNDVVNLVMAINESRKKNMKSEELKNEMNWIKYFFGFIINDIEKELVTNNFEINPKPYLISDSLQSIYNIPEELFQKMKSTMCHQNALTQLMEMFHYDDYGLKQPKNMYSLMIRQSYMRAFLLMMDEEEKSKLKDEVEDILNHLVLINETTFRIGKKC